MVKLSASISIQYDNIFSPFIGNKWEKGLEWIKSCGLEGAELIVSDPKLVDTDKIAKKLEQLGLKASTISTGQAMGIEGLAMTAASEYLRELTRKRLFEDIDFSVKLGRPNVTVGLIRGRGNINNENMERELLKREMAAVAEFALKKGVVLNLEPINRYECALLNSTDSVAAFIEEIGSPPNVGILYDAFHSNIEDANMEETIKKHAGMITNVHLADSNRRLPGEGHIDFKTIFKLLNDLSYKGYAALEVFNVPSREHIQKFAAARLQMITKE